MTLGQLREQTKEMSDDTLVLIYDVSSDTSDEQCLKNGQGQSIDGEGNIVENDPALYMRYPDKILPEQEFVKELEEMGEENVLILRI